MFHMNTILKNITSSLAADSRFSTSSNRAPLLKLWYRLVCKPSVLYITLTCVPVTRICLIHLISGPNQVCLLGVPQAVCLTIWIMKNEWWIHSLCWLLIQPSDPLVCNNHSYQLYLQTHRFYVWVLNPIKIETMQWIPGRIQSTVHAEFRL